MPGDSEFNVVDFPNPPSPPKEDEHDIMTEYMVTALNAAIKVLNARLLCLLGLLGGITIWMVAAFQGDPLCLWSAAGYSLSTLIPTLTFYARKG